MSYVDSKYIGLLSPRLGKFARKKDGLYNFRCPYCGDSQKNKNRARGYLYRHKSDHNFKCHNCGVSRSFTYFLKDIDESLYKEYLLERYKEGLTGKATVAPEPEFKFEKPNFSKPLFDLPTIKKLNTTHPARQYLSQRKIPEEYFSKLYYAEDYNAWAGIPNSYKESRIIIPLLSQKNELFGYQARSLNPKSKLRYLTNIFNKTYPKLFGLERVNENETVYVTEGPFDSMFIENGVAMCGADVDISNYNWDIVYIFDNEPRNKQICDRMAKVIDSGNKIVIWKSTIKEKDINDMVLAGKDVKQIIQCTTFGGLEAKIKFQEWKKL